MPKSNLWPSLEKQLSSSEVTRVGPNPLDMNYTEEESYEDSGKYQGQGMYEDTVLLTTTSQPVSLLSVRKQRSVVQAGHTCMQFFPCGELQA